MSSITDLLSPPSSLSRADTIVWSQHFSPQVSFTVKDLMDGKLDKTADNVIEVFDRYLDLFPPIIDEDKEMMFHESKTYSRETEVLFKSDLHGCYPDLERLMRALQTRGLLTDDYKIVESDKKPFKLVFMGDYADRGPESFRVLMLLLMLKMENPHVVLLRGNHEDIKVMDLYIHSSEKFLLENPRIRNRLEQVFATFPSKVYICYESKDDQPVKYLHVSHALFDPSIDFLECLSNGRVIFPKERKDGLSERIENLVDESVLGNKKGLEEEKDLLKYKNLNKPRKRLRTFKDADRKKLSRVSQKLRALRVKKFCLQNGKFLFPAAEHWGDMAESEDGPNEYRKGTSIQLSPGFLHDCARLNSDERFSLERYIRGHRHERRFISYKGRKGFVITLPPAGALWSVINHERSRDKSFVVSLSKGGSMNGKELTYHDSLARVISQEVVI